MDVLSAIFSCFPSGGRSPDTTVECNQMAFTEKDAQLADDIVDILFEAEKPGQALQHQLKVSYTQRAGTKVLPSQHPVFAAAIVTVVAIGILVLLVPWVVEALGFAELGPVEGSFAAWWQSTFPDAEAGSFFSYLQRLGMRWGKR
ncbi:hypothetical protein LTR37_014217 [Vermiconidia calcicola]|uniref:Uncharacterized protein n=1 Tax=Vermiconidia calcicola TaxID=1690605 RepID=A0ACC3MUR7_9PEZI|nr:hypothetical protein LTR37_014217 [Vermiconidia calcicola]